MQRRKRDVEDHREKQGPEIILEDIGHGKEQKRKQCHEEVLQLLVLLEVPVGIGFFNHGEAPVVVSPPVRSW